MEEAGLPPGGGGEVLAVAAPPLRMALAISL
jgi:hypothetical protein